MGRSWREAAHLAQRFARSLRPRPPSAAAEAWARAQLRPEEQALWAAQAPVDRAHSIAVARAVLHAVGDGDGSPPPWVVPAALLHDVGKADAGLGPIGRALATGIELVGPGGLRLPGRLGRYLRYPETGARQLAAAGAGPMVVAWAREHHWRPSIWSVPRPWADRLAAADRAAR